MIQRSGAAGVFLSVSIGVHPWLEYDYEDDDEDDDEDEEEKEDEEDC